jgi:hypothetical protein
MRDPGKWPRFKRAHPNDYEILETRASEGEQSADKMLSHADPRATERMTWQAVHHGRLKSVSRNQATAEAETAEGLANSRRSLRALRLKRGIFSQALKPDTTYAR